MKMSSAQEMQHVDRELSLELEEPPVNPALLQMLSPSFNGCNQCFYLEINGELLWKWRVLKLNPVLLFNALQENLSPLGYILSSGSMARIGQLLKNIVYFITKKLDNTRNGDLRRSLRAKYWATLAILEDRDQIFTQMIGRFPWVFCRGVVPSLNKIFCLSSLSFFGDYPLDFVYTHNSGLYFGPIF